uniref:Uncharacterized protein n=1 Tax=viral metagenome TaxID=1070528 RepID=A0A6M3K5G3_9ZZZZ
MLGTANEEIKKNGELEKYTEPLRERMDEEFALYRGDEDVYDIPAEEGEWERIITNRAMVESNRIIEDLSYANRKLYIPISDEDREKRKDLTATENAAKGILYLADTLMQDSPLGSDLQSLMAKYWVIRGMSVKRFLLREEEDKLIPDFACWDGRNTQWVEGRRRYSWVGYTRWAHKSEVEDEYKGWNGQADASTGLVKLLDVWDCSEPGKTAQEGVIDCSSSEYLREPKQVKVNNVPLDYIPIHINTKRGMPLILDDNSENIKFTAQSYLTNNKNLFTIESRLLSYVLTAAAKDAKAPIIIEWNGQGPSPIEKFRNQDPNVAGRVIVLDTSKGEALSNPLPPSNTQHILQMYEALLGLLGIGGLNPVAFGRINQALPAQGIDILSHAAMANERAFKAGLEGDFVWLASEAVRQYKLGDFDEREIRGYDSSSNPFIIKVSPKKIDDNWRFVCKIEPDLLRDKVAMLNAAVMAIKSGILSKRTARDEYQIVTDTDLEEGKVAQEQFRELSGMGMLEGLLNYIKDYQKTKSPETLFLINHAYTNLMRLTAQGGNGDTPNMRPDNRVIASRMPMSNVPQPVNKPGGFAT